MNMMGTQRFFWQTGANSTCSDINSNNYVNSYAHNPTPTPATIPTSHPINSQQSQYSITAQAILGTVNLDTTNIHEWAILDSGATSHFLVSAAPTSNKKFAQTPLKVRLPDGGLVSCGLVSLTHTCHLELPKLPTKARLGHIIPGLASHSLLSVVKLCNEGCEVTFTKINCTASLQTVVSVRPNRELYGQA